MNSLQKEHMIQVLELVVKHNRSLYRAATEGYRSRLEEGLNNVHLILDACGIETPQDFWLELEVWRNVPSKRLANYVEDNLKMADRMRDECDNVRNTLIHAERLLTDLKQPDLEFPGMDDNIVTGYQDAQ